MASVWPWAKMMRASLETVSEGGTATLVSQGLGGLVANLTNLLQDPKGEAPPPALPEREDTSALTEGETATDAPDS